MKVWVGGERGGVWVSVSKPTLSHFGWLESAGGHVYICRRWAKSLGINVRNEQLKQFDVRFRELKPARKRAKGKR